jgi:integrase
MVQTGATSADAAAEFLRYCAEDRGCKPSTLRNYRSDIEAHLLPGFGDVALEDITTKLIDRWRSGLTSLSPRTKNKLLVAMHGVMRRAGHVWDLPSNPVAGVEKQRTRSTGDLEVFSPEEVMALVRAAASEQDGVIYLTAAFTGLRRGELLALRWRDVDFPGSVIRVLASYASASSPPPSLARSAPSRWPPTAPRCAAATAQRSPEQG